MNEHVVYYRLDDEDRKLFVAPESRVGHNDQIIFRGSQKSCRKFVLDNESRNPKRSSKRYPPELD